MRILAITYLLINILLATYTLPAQAADALSLSLNTTEQSARQHCPEDEVVWLNLPTRIWHVKGARWYGNTKNGSYVCKKEAIATGNRASRNG